jgi:hypothetical protein
MVRLKKGESWKFGSPTAIEVADGFTPGQESDASLINLSNASVRGNWILIKAYNGSSSPIVSVTLPLTLSVNGKPAWTSSFRFTLHTDFAGTQSMNTLTGPESSILEPKSSKEIRVDIVCQLTKSESITYGAPTSVEVAVPEK